jgi:hypothetical protein
MGSSADLVERIARDRATILVLEDDAVKRAVTSDHFRDRGYAGWKPPPPSRQPRYYAASKRSIWFLLTSTCPGVMGGPSFTVWMHEKANHS